MGTSERPDLQHMVERVDGVKRQMIAAHEALTVSEVSGAAGGGVVTVTLRGSGEVTRVRIAPEVIDADDASTLEGLLLAAFRNATQALRTLTDEALSPFASGLGDLMEMINKRLAS